MEPIAGNNMFVYAACVCLCIGFIQGAEITEMPQDITAEVGDDVLLMCNVVISADEFDAMEWQEHISKASGARIFTSAKPTQISDPSKYSVTGNHNLLIQGTTFQDGGQYSCTLYSEGLGHMATLLVMDQPYITTGSLIVRGKPSEISCKIQYGGPHPDQLKPEQTPHLDIYLEEDLLSPIVTVTQGILGLSPNIITASVNYTAKESDNGNTISCRASTQVSAYQSTSTHVLDVRYPVHDINTMPDKPVFGVGEEITCDAFGNPTPTFRWRPIKTSGPREVTGSVLLITENMVGENEWRCQATNTVFNSEVIVKEISFSVSTDNIQKPVTPGESVGGAVAGIHPRSWQLVLVLSLLSTLYGLAVHIA